MGIRKKKIWLDKRSKKLHKSKRRRGKNNPNYAPVVAEMVDVTYNSESEYRAEAPLVFSFINNTEETAQMFSYLIDAIKRGANKKRFFIDSAKVEEVTTDVVLYIIAIIRNIKISRIRQYVFAGNLPKVKEAEKVYIESGLDKYVRSKKQELPANNSKMQIASGKTTDSVFASQICKFIMEKFGVAKKKTQYMYKTIIELMSNVVYHAYNMRDEIMYPEWYLYAEHTGNKIRLIFLDTGAGIATTVRKRVYERITMSDSRLIESAFNGEFRTETKKDNRGLGLPALKDYALENKFSSFLVISGKGGYRCEQNGEFVRLDFENLVYGTIYVIEIDKEIMK